MVWKGLRRNHHGYYSPYQCARYEMGVMKKSSLVIEIDPYDGAETVDLGLHSCLTKDDVDMHSSATFPAIIPTGSKFIVGSDNEVASDALIVYKTMKDLEAVHGKVGKPVQVKNAGKLVANRYAK